MANTTRTQLPAEVNNFYDRRLLDQAIPSFVYNRFAQVRDIPANSGTDTIKFRRYGLLTAVTTPLVEGVTPTAQQLSVTDITATVLYYGSYVTISDKVTFETYDPILTETAEIFGEQVGDSLDQLCRDVVTATTTKQYATGVAGTSSITSAMIINRTEIKKAVRTLKVANAKPITDMIDPTDGISTTAIGRSFIGIIHPRTTYDLDDAQGWIPVEKYPNKTGVMPDEVGALANVRFLESTNAKVRSGAGSGSIDVYSTLIIGKNAYAQTRISNMTLQNIVMPLGSAGTADPLKQRVTSGWKLAYVAKILNDAFMVDIQHAVSS